MEWERLLSEERIGAAHRQGRPEAAIGRSEFERDYDRIVFSPAFRRLQNKTQVFPLPGNIFVHNRLTHSLEVSCLGRSLGTIISRQLKGRYGSAVGDKLEHLGAITSAACLAHDLGNPPFGHSGEAAIAAYFTEGSGASLEEQVAAEGGRWTDFTHYEGNANGFRLLVHQFRGRRPGGFALTYSTLASMVKYPWSSLGATKNKFGFMQPEEEVFRELAEELGLIQISSEPLRYVRHPLVYLVEASDDICYQVMDIEDAYKMHIFTHQETMRMLGDILSPEERAEAHRVLRHISDHAEQVGYLRSRVINELALEAAAIFLDHEREILWGQFRGALLDYLSPQRREALEVIWEQASRYVHRAREVVDIELAGHRIFRSLLDHLLEAMQHPEHLYSKALLQRIPYQYDIDQPTMYGKILTALDYISGMTDVYALDLYRRITGMNIPAI